jgi:tetratricopeptide (TPR) repeat protein
MPKIDLEARLIENMKRGVEVDLERALLIVSGLETEEEVGEYVAKLDELQKGFHDYLDSPEYETELKPRLSPKMTKGLSDEGIKTLERANALFDFLWNKGSEEYETLGHNYRYESGKFPLPEVIDAQISEVDKTNVGNCLGLTALYSTLGVREGLNLQVIFPKNHILNILKIEWKNFDIENTRLSGFDSFNISNYNKRKEPLREIIGDILKSRAIKKSKEGDIERANDFYSKAIAINPKDHMAYTNRSGIKKQLGDIDGAIEDLEKAIAIKPFETLPLCRLALIRKDQERFDEAFNLFDKAILIDPKMHSAHYAKGITKRESGDLNGAIECLETSVNLVPGFVFGYRELGFTKHDLGDYNGVVKNFKKVVELEPESGEDYAVLAENQCAIAKTKEDLIEAKLNLERSIELHSEYEEAHYYLGLINYCLGDEENASLNLQQATTMGLDLKNKVNELLLSEYMANKVSETYLTGGKTINPVTPYEKDTGDFKPIKCPHKDMSLGL